MSPVGPLPPAPRQPKPHEPSVYTLFVFDELMAAPWVVLLDAENDAEAMRLARAHHPNKRRELWHKHRLIVAIS